MFQTYRNAFIYLKSSRLWLESHNLCSREHALIFVHVRRGDYLHWPSAENPAVLDIKWYLHCMEIMEKQFKDPFFVVMGDDHEFLKAEFNRFDRCFVSENSAIVDMALMSYSCGGILSASSFALLGSLYCKASVNSLRPKPVFLGPKYWAGHRSKTWYPSFAKYDWVTYVPSD